MTPTRIHRKRTKGWKQPPNTVYVGRPTVWGNPVKIGDQLKRNRPPMSAEDAVNFYRHHVAKLLLERGGTLEYLRGKHLSCFCPLDQPCHADVLLELANA